MSDDYEVGYGRPPRHTRFRKGHSGNPLGRPKGSVNLRKEMTKLLTAKTRIKVNGELKDVPTTRALCMAIVQKALSGNVRAFTAIAEILGPEMADELRAMVSDVTAQDVDLLRRALERRDRSQGCGEGEDGERHVN